MGDMIDRDAVLALVKAHIKGARRTYAGIHQAQEPLAFLESLMVPAIAALPAASSHPLASDARRALEADDVYGWINSLPAASAEDVRAGNRVTYNDDGTLDEIVTDAGVHLEDLGGNRWFLGAARSDGTEIRVWFRGKVTMIEDDAKGAKP